LFGIKIALAITVLLTEQGDFMNKDNLQRIIRVAGIAFSLFFAIGIFSTEGQAQRRNRDNHRNNDNQHHRDDHDDDYRYENNRRNRNNDNNNIYRGSVQHGYRDGIRQGAEDARNGRRSNAQRAANRRIRQATGNNPGPTAPYYREGYIRGYNEGYNRYDNNNDDYDDNNNDDYDYNRNR
jgi:hypothetical protein